MMVITDKNISINMENKREKEPVQFMHELPSLELSAFSLEKEFGPMYDMVGEVVSKMQTEIQGAKEKIIKEKLKSLGIELDMEVEQRRRFKSLVIESSDSKEQVFFNDGTIGGKLIVTFSKAQNDPLYPNIVDNVLTQSFSYY